MRYIVVCLAFVVFLYGGEFNNIDSAINDIVKLKNDYKKTKLELEKTKKTVEKQHKKIKELQKKLAKKTKVKIITKKEYAQPNKFPKLAQKKKPEIKNTPPNTFRLKFQSDIYDNISGKKIDNWEQKRSFTSNRATKEWVKITGYFIDKRWVKAKKDMWIQRYKVTKR